MRPSRFRLQHLPSDRHRRIILLRLIELPLRLALCQLPFFAAAQQTLGRFHLRGSNESRLWRRLNL